MEQQFGKIFGQGGLLSGSVGSKTAGSAGTGSGGLSAIYGEGGSSQATFGGYEADTFMMNARNEVQKRKDMLIDEARKARFEIAKLQ